MKLLFCDQCQDVFKLEYEERSCKCGKVSGRYINNQEAVVNGEGYSLAIGNGSLWNAVANLYKKGIEGDRREYIHETSVVCWVRPHEGTGNPHTTVQMKKAS